MHRRILLKLSLATAIGLGGMTVASAAEPVLSVAYAGSMGALMDKALGPAIAKQDKVQYQGQGAGAFGLAHLIAAKQINPDVFVSITPGPIEVLQKAGLIDTAVPVASTQMVIAYSDKSKFAADFKAAAAGKMPWYEVLEKPGLRFGRTDPKTDPQGRNIVFTMLLAQEFYKQPGLADKILGKVENEQQIFTEPSLLSRLESGQLDATSGYLSAVISHKLPYIKLPGEINLSDPAMIEKWYSKVHFDIKLPNGKTDTLSTQPLVFYAAVLKNAPNPKAGAAFVKLMTSAEGQALFKQYGYSAPKGGDLHPAR
ncbi:MULTISPECIES: extracellular solute-binding protein [unclassified Thiomonas]|jgi:molybdate/tungstate transport system substrate-binding protein|uniref:extracellular solute-binding protein n=1 Tax=unclassified Thiomonas TaxID=2625466 RepID=UPI000A759A13|nr:MULTISPECIES: extracellular solute-binding protein [unclassified Thiomonas]OZB70050.1 MAG: ABC transporter substrate-binding protein [Thiomonas sp. 13-64-67]OZB77301.1 MAG: ABC transporter substrate-binding protein [Thiomonas sp. 14-64-326]